LSEISHDAAFRTFRPPVKISGGVGDILLKLYLTTEPPKYIWWPSTARLLSTVDW